MVIQNDSFKILEKSPKHPRNNQIGKPIAGLLMFPVQLQLF